MVAVEAARNGPSQTIRLSRRHILGALGFLATTAAALTWSRSTVPVVAAVRFEIRLAEEEPRADRTAAGLQGSRRVVYLAPEPVVVNSDILSAEPIASDHGGFSVLVTFTDEGARKMHSATAAGVGSLLAVLLDGKVVAAPKITSVITGSAVITGNYSKDDAVRIAEGIQGF